MNHQPVSNDRILDARMEYGNLLPIATALGNMYWVAYGAYFTINTLLATFLGLTYSDTAKAMNTKFLFSAHILIPLTGIFIAGVAIHTAFYLRNLQMLANQRGVELEGILSANTFSRLQSHSARWPISTTIGALFFALLWGSALFAAF